MEATLIQPHDTLENLLQNNWYDIQFPKTDEFYPMYVELLLLRCPSPTIYFEIINNQWVALNEHKFLATMYNYIYGNKELCSEFTHNGKFTQLPMYLQRRLKGTLMTICGFSKTDKNTINYFLKTLK